jgi:hypothetical protein
MVVGQLTEVTNYTNFSLPAVGRGARVCVVVKALYFKPEGRGFETR